MQSVRGILVRSGGVVLIGADSPSFPIHIDAGFRAIGVLVHQSRNSFAFAVFESVHDGVVLAMRVSGLLARGKEFLR